MSNRYSNYKGSVRAPRDDSRTGKEGSWDIGERGRSRSPVWSASTSRQSVDRVERTSNQDKHVKHEYEGNNIRLSPNEWEDSDEDVPAPPPPPRITKISIGFTKPKEPIKMTLSGASKPAASAPKPAVASVFNNDDDDDEPEEMPAEARMRMRNIGRETPTSAGPNSFGKTKQGFCDAKKVFEKNLKQALETNQVEKPVGKFPQTIYKIKGP
ncbi:unnamed protein product [Diatraea saccharalis]|uniref:PEST proteolytic signal-containing nuclear protein n=1 Tax=Diatraea saccharalis TaxID=40085 RepID=A0A9N9WDG4_9NEOP|nr:unnamed protein product [Diatraea saccharalis]